MSNSIMQELQTDLKVLEGYKSDFSFFCPEFQEEFLTMEYGEIKYLFQAWPNDRAKYIHELWRTGRMRIVYAYFMDRERATRESIAIIAPEEEWLTDKVTMGEIAFNTAIMLYKGVPEEECNAFLHDLTCVSSNAHDNQEFGERPLNPNAIENVEEILKEMVLKDSSLMKDL